MSNILVTGSASGLGAAILEELHKQDHYVYGYDIKHNRNVLYPKVAHIECLDVLINCAGVNHIEWIDKFSESDWDHIMDVNVKGIFKMTQACLPLLIKSKGTIINILSNASWTPMTCSIAYNASKGAGYIMTQQMARELTRKYDIVVFGIAPNKLSDTKMSKQVDDEVCFARGWTKEYAKEYQSKALLTGEEIPSAIIANLIAYLLQSKDNHKFLSGCIIPYGA